MFQKYYKKILAFIATGALFVVPYTASAAAVNFNANTTFTYSAGDIVVASGSTATSITTTTTDMTVVIGTGESLTVSSSTSKVINSSPSATSSCLPSEFQVVLSVAGTYTLTPTATTCQINSGSSGGGSSGGSSGPTTSTPGTTVTKTLDNTTEKTGDQPYLQLPEADDANPVVGTDKNAKFPSSGRVTQKTTLKNAAGDAFVLVQGVRVKKANGKKYTGFVTAPKSLSVDTLTAAVPAHTKLPAGTLLKAVTVVFDEQVKMNKSMQLKFSVPQVTKKTKFKVFYFNEKTKKWVSAGKAIIGADKNTVFVNTKAQGTFILLQK